MWLDPYMRVQTWALESDILNGVSNFNFVFCGITVPIGMRAIVSRVSYSLNLSGQVYPFPTDRIFLRNRMRETSRFDYDRFTNNVNVPIPAPETLLDSVPGSYQNPETVDVYDFGNSGDTLIYGVRGFFSSEGASELLIGPSSFVEVDYLLVPPNSDVYTNAQDEGSQK